MGNAESISQQRSQAMQNYVDFDGQKLDVSSQPITEPKKKIPEYISLIGIAAILGILMWTVNKVIK
jgi:hypothetical protein